MKPLFALTAILLFACSNPVTAEEALDSELLLERAFYLETIKGSPAEALELYRQIQGHKGIRKQVRARAILGEAICLDAIGKDQLARKRFQDVIKRYPLQGEILEVARGYTRSRIWDTPARYMPEEMLFYAEMVQPGEEIIRLSQAVRGTPFENPIDSSRALAATPEATAALQEAPNTRPSWIAAILNQALFKELSKIGGVAMGIPAGGNPSRDWIAVLSPGESNAISSYISSLLTLAGAKRIGFVQELPLEELRGAGQSSFFAAGEQALVMGGARRGVEDAVIRFSKRSISLATNPAFLEPWSKKKDALMFFYIDNPSALLNPAGGSINNALGLGGGGPVSIALSTNPEADTLHATLWTRKQGPAAGSSWRQLATEPVDPELLRAIPPESLAFIAVADQDLKTKLAKIREWFKTNAVDEIPGAIEALETTPFNSLLEKTSSAIIGSYPNAALLRISESVKELGNLSGLQIYRPFYFAAFEFTDPESGEKALREALRKYAESLPGASKNLEFLDQRLEVQGESATHHYLKPLAGIRPGYIRIKNQYILSMSPAILKAALRSRQLEDRNRLSIAPKGASKVLYLRPKPIFSALSLLGKNPTVFALRNIKAAILYTMEGEKDLVLEIGISDLVPALNGFLKDLAADMNSTSKASEG
ncbi:MAG: hypothetical protein VYD81_03065 [Planctomycetota bacterium]|nr:hypothetical protein [Planctomycetota bacterium]